MLTTLLFSFVVFGLSDIRPSATASFGVTLLGVVWVGGGIGFLLLVRDIPDNGFWAVMAVLFTVFAADTAAFFVGRSLGRHRMAPAISPAKTWEGFVGGVVAAMVVTFVVLYNDRDEFLSIPEMLLLGAVIALAAVARRPLRVRREARPRGEGLRPPPRRPRWHARPPGRAPLGRTGCVLRDPRRGRRLAASAPTRSEHDGD